MKLTSPEFSGGGGYPCKYTGDGEDISPPLVVRDVPGQAEALVL